jgi:flagellar motor component MotA
MPNHRTRLKDNPILRRPTKTPLSDPNSRRWQNLLLPLGSLLVAVLTTITAMITQYQSSQLQFQLKQLDFSMKAFELTFRPKQDAYVVFMKQLYRTHETAISKDTTNLPKEFSALETAYLELDPYIDDYSGQNTLGILHDFRVQCVQLAMHRNMRDELVERNDEIEYQRLRQQLKRNLYSSLFSRSAYYR